jgi:hypothetical protein
VSDEAALRAAFANDETIDLQHDITLTDCSGGGGHSSGRSTRR